jgi:hypothetical protein
MPQNITALSIIFFLVIFQNSWKHIHSSSEKIIHIRYTSQLILSSRDHHYYHQLYIYIYIYIYIYFIYNLVSFLLFVIVQSSTVLSPFCSSMILSKGFILTI